MRYLLNAVKICVDGVVYRLELRFGVVSRVVGGWGLWLGGLCACVVQLCIVG